MPSSVCYIVERQVPWSKNDWLAVAAATDEQAAKDFMQLHGRDVDGTPRARIVELLFLESK